MPKSRFKSKAIIISAVLSGMLLVAIAFALLMNALNVVAEKTNELDGVRARELLQGAIRSEQARLTSMVTDNATWDDAYINAYSQTLDSDWLFQTWGAITDTEIGYSAVFILDENKSVLWSYLGKNRDSNTELDFFGNSIKSALMTLGARGAGAKEIELQEGIGSTLIGPAYVSARLIRKVDASIPLPPTKRRYLVFVQPITDALVAAMGASFGIQNLRLLDPDVAVDNQDFLYLTSMKGRKLGRLVWDKRLPGREAIAAARNEIVHTLVLIALSVAAFVFLFALAMLKVSRSEAHAKHASLTDTLSKLPNRLAIKNALDSIQAEPNLEASHIALGFIDLNGFKEINDTYGHNVGDQIIQYLAAEFSSKLPGKAILARVGGDEFAVLSHGPNADVGVKRFAIKCLQGLKQPIPLGDRSIRVGASIGISVANASGVDTVELFRQADVAMYHAKKLGAGCIANYEPALEVESQRRHEIEKGIRRGLQRNEFEVFYQPILDAHTLKITSVEALIRWPRRPDGEIFPDEFIPIAEKSSLIHALCRYVLNQACLDLLTFGDLKLSINISPAQFRDADFVTQVSGILKKTHFPGRRLELELTESYLMDFPARAATVIKQFQAEGISIALDDFGMGYSSIGYLQRYGFNKLKIDKCLAGRVDIDSTAAALVAGTVAIARALSMSVTAEGVENSERATLLRIAGCDHMQGYLFSEAVSIDDLHALLDKDVMLDVHSVMA